jgi:hypothetical protein
MTDHNIIDVSVQVIRRTLNSGAPTYAVRARNRDMEILHKEYPDVETAMFVCADILIRVASIPAVYAAKSDAVQDALASWDGIPRSENGAPAVETGHEVYPYSLDGEKLTDAEIAVLKNAGPGVLVPLTSDGRPAVETAPPVETGRGDYSPVDNYLAVLGGEADPPADYKEIFTPTVPAVETEPDPELLKRAKTLAQDAMAKEADSILGERDQVEVETTRDTTIYLKCPDCGMEDSAVAGTETLECLQCGGKMK